MVLTKSLIPFHTVTDRADTVLIVASGPSLRGFDLAQLHGKGYIIAVNGAAQHVNADAWVTVDTLNLERRLPSNVLRYVAVPKVFGQYNAPCPCDRNVPKLECRFLRRVDAFSLNHEEICGGNSAVGALNLAHHFGAKKVVMFGVDGHSLNSYFYGNRRALFAKQDETLRRLPEMFRAVAPFFTECKVVNASPNSAVTCFERVTPEEALLRL